MSGSTEHVKKDHTHCEARSADYQTTNASQLDRWDRLGWGPWDIPDDDLHALGGVTELDVQAALSPPADATTTYEGYPTMEWARAFPSEHSWIVQKRSDAHS